jgi:hypothetical protein
MKIKIKKEIEKLSFDRQPTWKDIKHIEFQDDDLVHIGYDEGHVSENNSWDPHFYVIVERFRDETDEEYAKRLAKDERYKNEMKERRYEQYLKLKKEFENDTETTNRN